MEHNFDRHEEKSQSCLTALLKQNGIKPKTGWVLGNTGQQSWNEMNEYSYSSRLHVITGLSHVLHF